MKPFLTYLTEDSKSTIDNNSKLLEKKLKAHGVDLPPGSPGSVHDWFNGVMGGAPEHHKLWIAKRYVSGGIAHIEDIPGTLNLLQRHDQLLSQGNISSGTLPKLKTNAELYSFINKNDPDKDVAVGNEKVNSELVKPHEYTVTGENVHWTEITPHTENASCYFGKGTNWCTAPTGNNSRNEFNEYIKQGPTHILVPKTPRYEGEKYQIHAPTEQVTDETNTSVDISKIENHDASGQMLKPEYHRPFPSGNINNYKLALQTHIDARDQDPEVAMAAVNSQFANQGTVNYAALHPDPAVAMAALGHRLVSNQTTQNAAEHPYTAVGVAALNHGASNRFTSYRAISNRNPEIALAGLKHKDATFKTARYAAEHPNPVVAMAALNSNLNFLNFGNESETVPDAAARHKSPEVALAALAHSQADNNTTHIAAKHPDPRVAMAALAHSQATEKTTQTAAEHPDSGVVMAALGHRLANEFTAGFAAKHQDPAVALAALAHPKADHFATHNGARNLTPRVVLAALNHKNADEFTVRLASSHLTDSEIGMAALNHKHASTHSNSDLGAHQDPAVALGALNHRLADMVTTIQTVKNKNPAVALATLKHPLADKRTTHYGAEHQDPAVAMAALAHPKADVETTYYGAFHKNPEVALAAVNHKHADDHTLANASIHLDPAVVMAAINHPYANSQTLLNAASHKDSAVVMAALAHPKADALTTKQAAAHRDPEVALTALAHPSGTEGTANYGAQHKDPKVAMAALKHKYANSFTTQMGAEHQDPGVALAALAHPLANATTFHAGQKHEDPEVRAFATKQIFQSESYSPGKIKPFLTYITEDSKQIIDANNNKIKARMVANGLAADVSELPENIHDSFSRSLGEIPEHHKSWIAKRYADGGIRHVEDIAKVSTLLKRHDELLAQKLVSPVALRNLKTDTDLFGLIQSRDPNNIAPVKNVNVSSDKVKPHEYTVTGENEHWTEITPHTENAACEFGRGTNWCTASTSNSAFNHYNENGPMHILIPKNPRYKGERYQIHPHSSQMMDHTDTSVEFSEIEGYQRPVPYKGKISGYKQTLETHSDVTNDKDPAVALAALASPHADRRTTTIAAHHDDPAVALAALAHPLANARTTHYAAEHLDSAVVMAALRSPHADAKTTHWGVRHKDPEVALAALRSPHADPETTEIGADHENSKVAMAALTHEYANTDTIHHAAIHHDPKVVMAALTHDHADAETTHIAVQHSNANVALAALRSPLANSETTEYGAQHRNQEVALAALASPHATRRTTSEAAFNSHVKVALAALASPHANAVTTAEVASHPDSKVAMTALTHELANADTARSAAKHDDPAVALAALASPHANAETTRTAGHHLNSAVVMAALAHPLAKADTTYGAVQNKNSEVVMAALRSPLANATTTRLAVQSNTGSVALAALNHKDANLSTADAGTDHRNPEVKHAALVLQNTLRKAANKELAAKVQYKINPNLSESYSLGKIKPFIRFLTEEDLTLEYHDTLNPKIWDGDQLKPEVQAKLLQIAKKWATFAKIPDFAVTDIILVGGNANYNWTKFSDLDLHVVVNREDLADCPDLLDDYLQNKKQLWALVHDITIYGHDVELYAQDKETPYPKKQGVYSVKGKKWIAQPKHENVDFRGPVLLAKVKQYTERIDTLISTNAEDESFSKLKEKFKNMRSAGLKKIGEFSLENLIFKELRNRGVIDRMTKYLQSRLDQKLSLNEDYDFQLQIHNKKTNELVGVKQLSSETKTDAMGKGLRALQLAKHNFNLEYPKAGDVADHHFSIRYPHDTSWITPTS